PRADSTGHVAAELPEANRLEQPAEALGVPVARGQQDDVAVRVDDPRGPRADAGVRHRHVEGVRRMGGVELARVTAVDQRRAALEELERAPRGERVEGDRFGDERAAVELDDPFEIRRLRLELAREALDELVLFEAEELVRAALEADSRGRLLAHSRAAAERPADVTGPELGHVVELEQTARGVEKAVRAFLGVDREVGAA